VTVFDPPPCGHRARCEPGTAPPAPSVFRSFWQAGFESACHVNRAGVRLDMIALTQHEEQVDGDYARLAGLGIHTCREAVRWHLVERDGRFDFSSLLPFLAAARQHDMQVLWNLCHYGWPDDVDLFDRSFPARFARYAAAVARTIAEHDPRVPFYVPVNEISFLAWAAGEEGYIFPYARNCGARVKSQLVAAAIAAIEAIREVDPRARFAHTEPLIHVLCPTDAPGLAAAAAAKCASQFEAWDALAGRALPGLGGVPENLDIVGVNFYHSNQWEHDEGPDRRETRLRWEDSPRDPRWVPLSSLLLDVYERYRRPIFLSETSHFGCGRGAWIREIAAEVQQARALGVPVEGICVYPILDRPDWEDLDHWHHSGLWDLERGADGRLERRLDTEYASDLARARTVLAWS
jgi:beta-glucosidase/6-phospho-beta-glucosidase/beta-galactosidase